MGKVTHFLLHDSKLSFFWDFIFWKALLHGVPKAEKVMASKDVAGRGHFHKKG
jgi:hypothetical protein